MLGWFGMPHDHGPGQADILLQDLARDLQSRGLRLAGAVQRNLDRGADCACDMEMDVLGEGADGAGPVRISQHLGAGSSGCRLDTGALEDAAHRAGAHLAGADLMIVPKFGRQEAVGRGFCDLIAAALDRDLPVILHVPRQQRVAFAAFAGDLAQEIAPQDVRAWCLEQRRRGAEIDGGAVRVAADAAGAQEPRSGGMPGGLGTGVPGRQGA